MALAPKIPLAEALDLLRQGWTKAQLARHYGCSRSAVTQKLKAHWTVPGEARPKAVDALLTALEAPNPDLARTLRAHAIVQIEGRRVRIFVHGNPTAYAALKTIQDEHVPALRRLWRREVLVSWL